MRWAMKKKVICFSAVFTLMCSTQVLASEFRDIEFSNAKEKIEYFDDEGYYDVFKDESTSMFYPNKAVTRGEFAILFHQVLNVDVLESDELLPFVDAANVDEKFYPYVQSSYYNHIISGRQVNDQLYFGYDDNMTREEMVTIIGRYLDLQSKDDILFADEGGVSTWAREYVSYFYNNEILKLDANGKFNPKDIVTREEATETLFKVQSYVTTQVDTGLVVERYIGSGNMGYTNSSYSESTFTMLTDLVFNENEELLLADSLANQIRIASNGEVNELVGIHTEYDFAGLPLGGYVDGSVDIAILDKPNKILVYDDNTLLFTQEETNVIRGYKIKEKEVYTLTGDIENGYENGSNTSTLFYKPTGLARDSEGNIYVADTLNNVIRKIDTKLNTTLYAGTPESYGNVVGNLTDAQFNEPTDLFMIDDVLYICDSGNNMVKKIEDGQVRIVAGVDTTINPETETQLGGDRDGSVKVAQLSYPTGVFVDSDGVVYIADTENNKIKVVKDGIVTTIAGNGNYGNNLGNALQASFDSPSDITVKDGVVYVADTNNHTVKIIKEK